MSDVRVGGQRGLLELSRACLIAARIIRQLMPLQAGTRLGPYEVVTLIGAGGMGEVWQATELRLGRKVALKLLPPDVTRDPDRILRFEHEARAASALNHPNVCTIYALDQTSEGQHYIAMEYVEGDTLRRRLTTSRLTVAEALDIASQVAAALSVAHTAGIIHRDIKPENVMLRPDGVVKVLDFGLAKLVPAISEGAQTTQMAVNTDAGTVVGTAAYMSPEQTRGEQLDARTDVFSLGVVLYEMATGVMPFRGKTSAVIFEAIFEPSATSGGEPPTRVAGRSGRAHCKSTGEGPGHSLPVCSRVAGGSATAEARHGFRTGTRRASYEGRTRPSLVAETKRRDGDHGRPRVPADDSVAGGQPPGQTNIATGRSDADNAPDHSSRAGESRVSLRTATRLRSAGMVTPEMRTSMSSWLALAALSV